MVCHAAAVLSCVCNGSECWIASQALIFLEGNHGETPDTTLALSRAPMHCVRRRVAFVPLCVCVSTCLRVGTSVGAPVCLCRTSCGRANVCECALPCAYMLILVRVMFVCVRVYMWRMGVRLCVCVHGSLRVRVRAM
jgi:hypothetical protein